MLLLLASLFQNPLLAEDYYIMYTPSCMDRLEYAYGFTPDDQHYVKYHIKVNATEVIVLEVGLESESPTQSYLNSATVSCGDEILNRELADRIRNNQDRVFMVRQNGSQYQISRVNMASYFRRDDRGVVYDSWQFSFNHTGGLRPGEVLTDDPDKLLKVTYEGTSEYKCTDAYRFRMEFSNSSNYRDLFFLPGVGIVEERPNTGSPGDVYKLEEYNDTPFETYLQKVCRNGTGNLASNFLPGGNTGLNNVVDNSTAAQYHEVEKGETAYSISRKYNISIDELRAWNPEIKNASLVQVGDRIRVSPPEGSGNAPTGANSEPQQNSAYAWNNSTSNNSAIASNATSGYNTGLPANMTSKGQSDHAWNNTNGEHVVKPGETVALLALKYGYTEERFRDMNNLGPNEFVKIGQRVKTSDCPSAEAASSAGNGFPPGTTNPYNDSNASPAPPRSSNTAQNNFFSGNTNNSLPDNSNTNNTGSIPSGSLPTSSTLPTYNNSTAGNGMGTALSPRSPNTTLQSPGTSATPPQRSSSSSFEPYGASGPDFGSLPPADYNSYNQENYQSNSNLTSQGIYPNTDSPDAAPGNTQPNYYNTGRQPNAQPPAASSGFGTPIPSSGSPYSSDNGNTRGNTVPAATGNGDPFSSSFNTQNNLQNNNSSNTYQAIHIVREGDTLESIARKYNTSAERLRQINNLERTEVLIPYQKLYID